MFVEPQPLPDFIGRLLPFRRRGYVLQSGPDAGKRIHFIDEGARAARPVLMLHGNPMWSFLWRKVIAELPMFRCVAPDLLGFGFSDKSLTVGDHSVTRHADAIAGLVTALDLTDVILLGQDWGGPILTSVAARIPDRISAAVMGNTAIVLPARFRGTWFHRFSRVPLVSTVVFRGFGFPMSVLHRVQGDRSSIRGDVARAYRWPLRTWRDRSGPIALARMVPSGENHPSVPELRRGEAWMLGFDGPLAFVWGMRDPILGRALAKHEQAFPNATFVRTDAGHFLQEEVPAELARAVVAVAAKSEK